MADLLIRDELIFADADVLREVNLLRVDFARCSGLLLLARCVLLIAVL